MAYAAITGWGMYVPERVLSNADLEKMVDTSDEWIRTRTGIRERRVVGPNDSSSTMGAAAARQALEQAGISADQVDLIVVGTYSPDKPMPSTACLIQTALGATHAAPFDVQAVCSGFVYSLVVATQFIRSGASTTALVIGSDMLTRYMDYTDRNTCILFGDGAGAVVLQASTQPAGVITHDLGAFPGTAEMLHVPGKTHPLVLDAIPPEGQYMKMEGREVFKYAVRAMGDSSEKVISEAGLDVDDIDLPISKATALDGKPAPELTGIIGWHNTPPIALKDLRGKVVVLDFFAYYCSICHAHKPDLQKLRQRYEREGLVVLAIHDSSLKTLDEMNAKMEPILNNVFDGNPPKLPMALDGAGANSVFEAYGIYAVPAVMLIDQEGRIVRRYHHAGIPELEADVRSLLSPDLMGIE